jgi:hypothetical protein
MTLILTEITKFGIAMVADSAITTTAIMPSATPLKRVTTGALKLQIVPYLNAGISFWGAGTIPYAKGKGFPTDMWLQDFIKSHKSLSSFDDFAAELKAELQALPEPLDEELEFHFAGYKEIGREKYPTLYHIRNVEGDFRQGYKLHEFVVGKDFPSQSIGEIPFTLRNGDYGPYALLSGLVNVGKQILYEEMNLEIPHRSLEGRVAYLASWIIFISNIYASARRSITIGGEVWALGIAPSGEVVLNTKIANSSNLLPGS